MVDQRQPLGRPFLTIWAGQTVSELGSTMTAIAAAIYVFVETGSTAWLGVLSAVAALPALLTAVLAATLDRCSRRAVMVAGDIFAASGSAFALLLAMTGRLEVVHLVVAGCIAGLGTAAQTVASQAAITGLVAASNFDRANSLKQLGGAAAMVIAMATATPVLAAWGIQAVLAIDLMSFVVGLGSVLFTPFDDAPASGSVADDGSWRDAWRWLSGRGRALLTLMAVASIANFAFAFFNLSILAIATVVAGTARTGLVLAVGGLAMVGGSVVATVTGLPEDRIRVFAIALGAAGIGFAVAASRPNIWLLCIGVALGLATAPIVGAAVATIYNERVPSQMQGRVFALRGSVSQALQPVGSVLAGFAIARVANPAMESPWMSDTIGRVIGTGESAGAALVMLATAMVLLSLGTWLYRSRLRTELMPEQGLLDDRFVVCVGPD